MAVKRSLQIQHWLLRVLFSVALATAAAPVPKPNVVLIMADDLGYGDLGCYGATKISTPHCDRLAREGRRFTDAHAPAASCSPTRFGLLTGSYPWRENRVPGALNANQSYTLRDHEVTVASLLKDAGYATGCIGKWHLGTQRKRPVDWNAPLRPGPNAAGFDYYFGVINSHNQAPFVLVENDHIPGLKPEDRIAIEGERNQTAGPRLRDEKTLEATQAAKAVAFIKQNRERPFFLYYPTAAVHDPYTPSDALRGTSGAGVYGDYVQEFDWAVGQVLAALDDLKLTEHTIVVITSDNGAQQGRVKAFGHKSNGELRAGKGTAYEGGHRVPFLVRWPGKVPANSISDQTICHVDFMATICAAVGIEMPLEAGPDSWNILPAWLGQTSEKWSRGGMICVGRNSLVFSLRLGPWKLLFGDKEDARSRDKVIGYELYNLATDPAEQNNLAASQPEKVKELAALLLKYRSQGYSRPDGKGSADNRRGTDGQPRR